MDADTSAAVLAGLVERVAAEGRGNTAMYGPVAATAGVKLQLAGGTDELKMQVMMPLPGAIHLYDLLG